MKKTILKILIIAITCALLFQLNVFAGYSLTLETKTDATTYAVGGTVNVTIDWAEELQAVDFMVRYNSTKLELLEDSYQNRTTETDETSGDSFTNVRVSWSATEEQTKKTNITLSFKALTVGNATISVINSDTNAFSDENLQQPEQIDCTTKGSKTIKISALGDINLDGIVNGVDSAILTRYIAGWTGDMYQLNDEQLANADVCADKEINQLDADILSKYVSGWAITFPFVYGDVNCDGVVKINDATLLQKYNLPDSKTDLSREGVNRADVNLDGEVNEFDYIIIQRYLARMQNYSKLPISILENNNGIKKYSLEYTNMISGFDINNLSISNIKQQLSSDLKIDVYNKNDDKIENDKLLATGYKLKIDDKTAEEVPEELAGIIGEYTSIIYGDTSGDGKINAVDALALIKDINNKINFTSEAYRQAGRIVSSNDQDPTAVDALAIIKAANGQYEINQNK